MNLKDAFRLADVIDSSDKAELIAVGRFVAPDRITPELPWGCSVRLADESQQVVWSIADWCRLVDPPTACKPEPVELQSNRPDAVHRRQPTLF